MLKNVFKVKKKDKGIKNKCKKSSSLDVYNLSEKQKFKKQQQTANNKATRSKTNGNDSNNQSRSRRKVKLSLSQSPAKQKRMDLNDYVLLTNKQRGLIRYIGNVHFGKGEWFGIELIDGSIGTHDGKVGNQRYFKTASKNAKFVKCDAIRKILKSLECLPIELNNTNNNKLNRKQSECGNKKKEKAKG